MAERQCENCGETADSARAFCPACGEPFVQEEKREKESNYEIMNPTVQMGQTMYGQMLSDMGLNISKPQGEKRVETLAPIGAAPQRQETPVPEVPRQQTLKPVAGSQPPAIAPPPPVSNRKSYLVWGLIAGGLLLIGIIAVMVIAVVIYFYLPRVR